MTLASSQSLPRSLQSAAFKYAFGIRTQPATFRILGRTSFNYGAKRTKKKKNKVNFHMRELKVISKRTLFTIFQQLPFYFSSRFRIPHDWLIVALR